MECAFPRGLARRPWRSYGLVEDMEYSWTLRVAGEQILFRPDVKVFGAMLGSGGKAAADQRRRWEFGRSEIRNKYLGPLLRSPDIGFREKALSICELTIPSLAWLASFTSSWRDWTWWHGLRLRVNHTRASQVYRRGAAALFTAALLVYAISPFLALQLPLKYLTSVVLFPFYMGWKLLISLAGRPQKWIRTTREVHPQAHRSTEADRRRKS